MQLILSPVKCGGILLSAEGTTVTISGYMDSLSPGDFMQPFIRELNKEIIKYKVKSITLNIIDLAFLNSAGIREIVDWILMLDTLPEEQRYSIHIIYSSRYLWQESSISTFVFLNTDFVSKEIV